MKFSFEQIQHAFIEKSITLDQFIEVLIDNFGAKKTRKILRKNLELAMKKESKDRSMEYENLAKYQDLMFELHR